MRVKDHCANITASLKITNILERRSSPVIKDGAYEDITSGSAIAAQAKSYSSHFSQLHFGNTKNTEKRRILPWLNVLLRIRKLSFEVVQWSRTRSGFNLYKTYDQGA